MWRAKTFRGQCEFFDSKGNRIQGLPIFALSSKFLKLIYAYNVDCSQSPVFRNVIAIECFASLAAILDECQIYLGGGGQFGRKPSSPHHFRPNACPLGTHENKMAVLPVRALSWTSDDLIKK